MQRILPPILFMALLVPLALLWWFHPEDYVMRKDGAMPWDVPLLLGVAIIVIARWQFVKRQTEINTFKTPGQLVTDGLFRFSRNPIYIGFLLLLVAAAFYANTWCALIAPLVFFKACMYWYIPIEENNMRTQFGDAYDDYTSRVRRWV